MNCRDWQEQIALHAEADLPPDEALETERHLAECTACREFAAGVIRSLAVLRAAHATPIEPAHLAAVRARVLGELRRERRRVWPLGWAGALVAAAALLAFIVVPRPSEPVRAIVNHPPAPSSPALLAGPVEPPAPVRPPRARPNRPSRSPRRPPEPLIVKLVTDDPNVVIYWIPN